MAASRPRCSGTFQRPLRGPGAQHEARYALQRLRDDLSGDFPDACNRPVRPGRHAESEQSDGGVLPAIPHLCRPGNLPGGDPTLRQAGVRPHLDPGRRRRNTGPRAGGLGQAILPAPAFPPHASRSTRRRPEGPRRRTDVGALRHAAARHGRGDAAGARRLCHRLDRRTRSAPQSRALRPRRLQRLPYRDAGVHRDRLAWARVLRRRVLRKQVSGPPGLRHRGSCPSGLRSWPCASPASR